MTWIKNCPECGKEQSYAVKGSLTLAIKNNSQCSSCSKTSKNHPMYGKYHTKESKQKMSISATGRQHSKETRQKMRISRIQSIEKNKLNGGQLHPNYNPLACQLFDWMNMYYDLNIQHAENGGEVKMFGYFADGYDTNTNTVYEYYENTHKRTIDHDKLRKQNIIDHLDCKFIEIKEWEHDQFI